MMVNLKIDVEIPGFDADNQCRKLLNSLEIKIKRMKLNLNWKN
jgi:hypothetical protein